MRKVTTVNLNGNAYQLEEAAYEKLREYLERADVVLRDNPDRAEILADLEQAIGDKCDTCLGAHKNVVSEREVEQILREMGPVEGSAPEADAQPPGAGPGAAAFGAGTAAPEGEWRRKRLYRLPTEGMLGGVCAGFAAYFNLDVVWIRLAFLLLAFTTGGLWILAWIAMWFVMPVADTAEEIAAAHGEPLNAREVIDRAKKKSAEYASAAGQRARRDWERFGTDVKGAGDRLAAGFAGAGENVREYSERLRERARRRRAFRHRHDRPVSAGARLAAGLSLPLLSLLSAALFVAFVFAVVSLLTQGHVLGFMPLPSIPLWLALLGMAVLYFAIGGPVGAARRLSQRYANGGRALGWASSTDGLLWVMAVVLFFYLAWHYAPDLQSWLEHVVPTSHGPASAGRLV